MKFLLVQSRRCPTNVGWYRKVDSMEELDKHETTYARTYWNSVWRDPHFEAALKALDAGAFMRHPMNLLSEKVFGHAPGIPCSGAYTSQPGRGLVLPEC